MLRVKERRTVRDPYGATKQLPRQLNESGRDRKRQATISYQLKTEARGQVLYQPTQRPRPTQALLPRPRYTRRILLRQQVLILHRTQEDRLNAFNQ